MIDTSDERMAAIKTQVRDGSMPQDEWVDATYDLLAKIAELEKDQDDAVENFATTAAVVLGKDKRIAGLEARLAQRDQEIARLMDIIRRVKIVTEDA